METRPNEPPVLLVLHRALFCRLPRGELYGWCCKTMALFTSVLRREWGRMIDELCRVGQNHLGSVSVLPRNQSTTECSSVALLTSESVCGFPHVKSVTPCVRKYLGHNDWGLHRSTTDGSTVTVGENHLLAMDDAPEMPHVLDLHYLQPECLQLCLTKGLRIQQLQWWKPKVTCFHLQAWWCIRDVLIHLHALENRPWSFQRSTDLVYFFGIFFSWFIWMHFIFCTLCNFFYFLTICLLTLVFGFLGKGKRESWWVSSLKREDNVLSHLELFLRSQAAEATWFPACGTLGWKHWRYSISQVTADRVPQGM